LFHFTVTASEYFQGHYALSRFLPHSFVSAKEILMARNMPLMLEQSFRPPFNSCDNFFPHLFLNSRSPSFVRFQFISFLARYPRMLWTLKQHQRRKTEKVRKRRIIYGLRVGNEAFVLWSRKKNKIKDNAS
jgi:hypothetical protein